MFQTFDDGVVVLPMRRVPVGVAARLGIRRAGKTMSLWASFSPRSWNRDELTTLSFACVHRAEEGGEVVHVLREMLRKPDPEIGRQSPACSAIERRHAACFITL